MDLIFSDHDAIFSRLIKWFTRSNCSHAAMVMGRGGRFIYQASGLKINLMTTKFFERDHRIVARFKVVGLDSQTLTRAENDVLDKFGRGYDWKGILGITYCIIMERLFGKDVKNPWNSRSSYWCSELVAYYWDRINYWRSTQNLPQTGIVIDPDKVSPQDLVEIFRKNPTYFKETAPSL